MSAGVAGLESAASFRYRASTDAGAMVEGVLRAATRDAALRELRRQQLWPVAVDPVASRAPSAPRMVGGASARRRAVAQWTRTVATLLDAGAPLDRALTVAQSQSNHAEVTDAAQAIRRAVQGGASLAGSASAPPGHRSATAADQHREFRTAYVFRTGHPQRRDLWLAK